MSDERPVELPASFEMALVWKLSLAFLPLLGLLALGYGLTFFFLPGVEGSTAEATVAAVAGLLLQPFGWTALQNVRVTVTAEELTWLGFGFVCGTRRLALDDLARFGQGFVSSGRGGRERMLLLEERDGTTHSIKLAMYTDCHRIVDHLAAATGREPEPVESSLLGLRFEEPGD